MQQVRDFRPVRLNNGLVVLWDFVENKAYPATSVVSPSDIVGFSKIGPMTECIYMGTRFLFRLGMKISVGYSLRISRN